MSPAGDVDEMRAPRQMRQARLVEEVPRLASRRQEADENARRREERPQLGRPGERFDTRNFSCARRSIRESGKAKRRERRRHRLPKHAEAQDADAELRFRKPRPRLPTALALLRGILARLAVRAEHGERDVLRHRRRHSRILETNHRNVFRQRRNAEQSIDAGAEIEDRPRRPRPREELCRRFEDERVVGIRQRIRPHRDRRVREAQRRAPHAMHRARHAGIAAGSSSTGATATRRRCRRDPPPPSPDRPRGISPRPRRRRWVLRSCAPSSLPRGSSAAHPCRPARRA